MIAVDKHAPHVRRTTAPPSPRVRGARRRGAQRRPRAARSGTCTRTSTRRRSARRSAAAATAADPKGLLLWGIDELLTYHYLVAEVFRVVPARQLPYETFWKMTKREQADHIWKHLFVERSPISEACRGVLTTLAAARARRAGAQPRQLPPLVRRAGSRSAHRPRDGDLPACRGSR